MYSVDGITIPTCAGAGTAFSGTSTTIAVPDPSKSPLVVNVIACGANQTASTLQTGTFPIVVANPVVTDKVGTIALASTDGPALAVSAQNAITATIASPTATSWVCYTTNGSAPSCGATASTCNTTANANQTLVTALPATVNVATSGTVLHAIACEGALTSGITGPITYAVQLSPVTVVGTPTAACPSVVTFGFDNTTSTTGTANVAAGGISAGATLCYSQVGAPTTCTAGVQAGAGTVACFTPTAANPTTTASASQTGTIFVLSCDTGFAGTGLTSVPATVTPYAEPTITVDGTLTDWPAADLFNGGGFTFSNAGATLNFAESGFTAAAGTSAVIYLADSSSAANTTNTNPAALGGGTLPFAAHAAIAIATTGGTCAGSACVTTYMYNGAAWVAGTGNLVNTNVTAVVTATALEASIPTVDISGAGTVNVAGAVTNGTTLSLGWPQFNGAWGFVSDSAASCQASSAGVQ